MPLADIGERLQRSLEIVVGCEQWLRDVGACPRSDGDPTPARAFVDEPYGAGRTFAVDDDLRDIVAQLDGQVETGVDLRFRSKVESRAANLPPLNIDRAHRSDRRRTGIGAHKPSG